MNGGGFRNRKIGDKMPADHKQNRDKDKPKVSVIVPVYDVEDCLERCVDSLAGQTLGNIEIILVDDGSTDRSGEMCDEYASRDGRIQVIHTVNRGLSCARNRGIAAARADYIMFVDSDDWVEPDFCELPYRTAVDHGAELVIFGIDPRYDDGTERILRPVSRQEGEVSRLAAMKMLFDADVSSYAWNKLYARRLFEGVGYPEGKYYEDIGTTHLLIGKAESIRYISAKLYHYSYRRPGSITASAGDRKIRDWLQLSLQRKRDLERAGYDLSDYHQREAMGILIQFGRRPGVTEAAEEIVKTTKGLPKVFTRRYKIMLMIYRLSPELFDRICEKSGVRTDG